VCGGGVEREDEMELSQRRALSQHSCKTLEGYIEIGWRGQQKSTLFGGCLASSSIRQHTSAYVSIRHLFSEKCGFQ
jgi:hypothetical protein